MIAPPANLRVYLACGVTDMRRGFDVHAACWAHARRKFFDVHEATMSPIAAEALRRIGDLYAIEAGIAAHRADHRLTIRQDQAVPL